MACSPNSIRNDSYNMYLWIEVLKSQHNSGSTPRHCTCIYYQHDRCREQLCNLSSTSHIACAALSIVESHDSFNNGDIGRGSSATKNVEHTAGGHHPGIQVIAGLGCGKGEMGRIDIVRSNFEWLHPYASSMQMCNESCRDGCFAYSTGRTSQNDSGNSH